MNIFLKRIVLFVAFGLILNISGGYILRTEKRVLTRRKLYYQDLRMDEFYNQKENVDIIFLGSSRTYQTFVPSIVDSITKLNSFNLGSSMQTPITSYFVLKEAYKYCQPHLIVMDLALDVMCSDQLFNGGYIIDAMRLSLVKLDFFFNGFDFKEQMELLLPVYRYRRDIDFFYHWAKNDIAEHYDRKLKYHEKGFVENYIENDELKEQEFTKNDTLLKNIKYLHKISELAEQNGTELVFIYLPYPSYQRITNEREFIDYIDNVIVEQLDKEFINYLEIDNDYGDEYFADYNHFNLKGAKKFSREIGKMIAN
ncbi:MAG: hypothetical protein K9M99_05210 [Candidatus Cloacimonetes bacterium]|nr:hypothetical protein [Candidatus Cloacimonadota bacterium]